MLVGSGGTGLGGLGGAAGNHNQDHCTYGFAADPRDAQIHQHPRSSGISPASRRHRSRRAGRRAAHWMHERVWEQSHDAWHNVRRCKGGGAPPTSTTSARTPSSSRRTRSAPTPRTATQFLVMHRHMMHGLAAGVPAARRPVRGVSPFPVQRDRRAGGMARPLGHGLVGSRSRTPRRRSRTSRASSRSFRPKATSASTSSAAAWRPVRAASTAPCTSSGSSTTRRTRSASRPSTSTTTCSGSCTAGSTTSGSDTASPRASAPDEPKLQSAARSVPARCTTLGLRGRSFRAAPVRLRRCRSSTATSTRRCGRSWSGSAAAVTARRARRRTCRSAVTSARPTS